MKFIELTLWLVASGMLFAANVVSYVNYLRTH
jgi:hypothetical protein